MLRPWPDDTPCIGYSVDSRPEPFSQSIPAILYRWALNLLFVYCHVIRSRLGLAALGPL
jgi:hypothetical protein